jgi:preprotein translocase subunit SecD
MRRGPTFAAAIVLLAVAFAAPLELAQASSRWERLCDGVLGWFGISEEPNAALARLGGTRLLLQADRDDYRTLILNGLRDDVRHLMRDARIPYSSLGVRDGGVELRVREPSDLQRTMSALAATAGPAGGAVDIRDAGEGMVRLTPTERAFGERLGGSLGQTVEIIRRRLNGLGLASVGVQREGADRILVVLPGVSDPARLTRLIEARALLEFRLVDVSIDPRDAMKIGVPAGSELLHEAKTKELYLVRKDSMLGGQDIADAKPSFSTYANQPVVDFSFTARGAREFGRLTQENIGRPFAIVLDGEVITAPVIREPILGGTGQISGAFTVEQASDLAILLRAGMLPVRLIAVEQTTVEPAQK